MSMISVIVPIYNVENYLSNCIDSILKQSYKNIEIILVNDGSTDSSGEICNEYVNKYKRIKVLNKNNGGVSSARNVGIKSARGDYISFIDPDDTIEPDMYTTLLETSLTYKADIVVCPIKTINVPTNKSSISTVWKEVNCLIGKSEIEKQLIPSILEGKTFSLVSCVNKLYKKSILDRHEITFDENKTHGEDAKFNFSLVTVIDSLVFIKKPLYNYFKHERDSLTQIFNENLYESILDNKSTLFKICNKYNYQQYEKNIRHHFTTVTLTYLNEIIGTNIDKKKKVNLITRVLKDKDFTRSIRPYKAETNYYKLLKLVCLLKNEYLFYNLVRLKINFQFLFKRRLIRTN
ncbi:glycosyltransferase [Salipaludibacillus sp. HK11]|uniref:glycosyltransferase n=1 Tax=Salipaludibacillus sp. HK11 TaxID=3394320 RepID=UPI0039FC32A3